MNCEKARCICNRALDGLEPPLAREAERHLQECPDCREWKSGMERVLEMMMESPEPAVPDIARAVMARLPAQHPASIKDSAWWRLPPRLSALVCGCIVFGFSAWTLILISLSRAAAGITVGSLLDLSKLTLFMLGDILVLVNTIVRAMDRVALSVTGSGVGFLTIILWALIFEASAAAVFLLRRRRRHGVSGIYSL